MRISMIGLNHRTAKVELREQLSLTGTRLESFIDLFRSRCANAELVIVSTCNRTEIYTAHEGRSQMNADVLRTLYAQACKVDQQAVHEVTINRENDQAIAHLFHVSCGLESMVLGEYEIVGQIRKAYEEANQRETVGPVLHTIFQNALATTKQVRNSTGIDEGRMSVASIAVEFSKQIFDHFADKTICGIGTGDMTKLMLKHLALLEPREIFLTNRTLQRAHDMAELLGKTVKPPTVRAMEDLPQLLIESDIIVTSTGAEQAIITSDLFDSLVKKRRGRPLFIIDIAIPRDVEPEVGSRSNVYLYNIDDLQQIVSQTQGKRQQHVAEAEKMIAEKVKACYSQVQHRDIGVLIRELRSRLQDIGKEETQRTVNKLSGATDEDAQRLLDEHTHRLINKILHMPLTQLDAKTNSDAPLGFYAAALRKLFDLDGRTGPGFETASGKAHCTKGEMPTKVEIAQEAVEAMHRAADEKHESGHRE